MTVDASTAVHLDGQRVVRWDHVLTAWRDEHGALWDGFVLEEQETVPR
jgi:hypothetical protein